MKNTIEYFNMSEKELTKVVNEYGYTKEECKLFDSALKVILLNSKTTHEEIEDSIKWTECAWNLKLTEKLKLIDNRIALLFD